MILRQRPCVYGDSCIKCDRVIVSIMLQSRQKS